MIKIYEIWTNFNEFVQEVITEKNPITLIILDCLHEVGTTKRFSEKDLSILVNYVKSKNIPVKILTPNLKSNRVFEGYDFDIINWETFWFVRTYWMWYSNQHVNKKKNVDIQDLNVGKDFKILYPYVCLNNICKTHRSMIMDLLAKNNVIDKGKITWRGILPDPNYNFAYKHWNPTKIILDQDTDVQFCQETMPIEFNNSFMQIVTESDDRITFFTEKTATPLLLNKPFLVAANKGFHTDLKNLGFELYDELFDYSFDMENDDLIRYQGLVENVKKYADMQGYELQKIYDNIFDKLVMNKKLALHYATTAPIEVFELQKILDENNVNYSGPLNRVRDCARGI